ncbi:MAG: delta(1)-pyrroline-2-carboxylate reductase family protein [Pseudomonadota bacterium]
MPTMTPSVLDAQATTRSLPYAPLVEQLRAVLADPAVRVPQRMVQVLPGGGALFLMPGFDAQLAITKLLTYTPGNAGTARPTIQGDVAVYDIASGERRLILDGPAVTARRTAAVSLLAAQLLAPNRDGPLLVVGAGVQGRAHVEAFAEGLGVKQVRIASRSTASAQALAAHARTLGLDAEVVADADAALRDCPLVAACTPARAIALSATPRDDAFIAAVGAYTPQMAELGAALCRACAEHGFIAVDTPDALHEAGDLLQAGLDVAALPSLREVLAGGMAPAGGGPVLFKSCGWGGWDLAAARCAVQQQAHSQAHSSLGSRA